MTSVYDLIGVTLRGAAGGSRWMATERVYVEESQPLRTGTIKHIGQRPYDSLSKEADRREGITFKK